MHPATLAATDWLKAFAQAVRDRDFEAGRRCFEDHAMGFGTVCVRADGVAELEQRQWRAVWPVNEGFDFDYDDVRVFGGKDTLTVATCWRSTGLPGSRQLGVRCGRASLVLQRRDGVWRAVHSHFSLDPA
jgi:ketosteroid isomerase-like protein